VVTSIIGGGMKRFTFVPKDAADKKYRLIFQYFGLFFTASVSLSRASPRIFFFFRALTLNLNFEQIVYNIASLGFRYSIRSQTVRSIDF